MKKVLVAALAVALAAVMAVPAGAFENEFGGYWRTRAVTNQDFSGDDTESLDAQYVDTRTHLYYTAKFSDDFKFVNKFEFDTTWGDDVAGKMGADGNNFELKNSYVDYNLGNYNFKIGSHQAVIARGFVMWDDFSGVTVTGQFGDVEVPFYWMKAVEGTQRWDEEVYDAGQRPDDANDYDKDIYAISPVFKSGNLTINPFLMYVTQGEQSVGTAASWDINQDTGQIEFTADDYTVYEDLNAYNVGINLDAALGNANAWFTGIYQGGSVDIDKKDYDMSAYLVALGGDVSLNGISLHGQMFYATGDDDSDDSDKEAFADLTGVQSYYWSEIMGYGMVDNQLSNNAPGDAVSNIMAYNLGASMSPMEKLTVGADLWYAMLAEKVDGEDELGTELDLTASYAIMDNLNLDVVAAYLFAGDATGDEDPMELGAQLSLSF